MTNVERLLAVGSEALSPSPNSFPELFRGYPLGSDLYHLLEQKNGFYAFEFALHVFPHTADPGTGLEGWNSESLWRADYKDLAEGLLFFAEDIFQDQFCLSKNHSGVFRFQSETGATIPMADSIESWAGVILSDYKAETGWALAHAWLEKNGPLEAGKRLMPKTPFFLGGEYNLENLWAGDPLEGMRFKADVAMQTRDLPDGAQVRLKVAAKPPTTDRS